MDHLSLLYAIREKVQSVASGFIRSNKSTILPEVPPLRSENTFLFDIFTYI